MFVDRMVKCSWMSLNKFSSELERASQMSSRSCSAGIPVC